MLRSLEISTFSDFSLNILPTHLELVYQSFVLSKCHLTYTYNWSRVWRHITKKRDELGEMVLVQTVVRFLELEIWYRPEVM